ncbi:hypothetical protein ACFYN3_28465 [Streptomyces lavendulae]|uniref:hypothetical protein n=1 Tax=Streptomyces lavendulae TaxID=1914 RepID=UPI0036792DAF
MRADELDGRSVAAFGRTYWDVSVEERSVVAPVSVASRSLEQGFTREDFAEALTELTPIIVSQSNVLWAAPGEFSGGEGADNGESPEFKAAVAEYGFGITVPGHEVGGANRRETPSTRRSTRVWSGTPPTATAPTATSGAAGTRSTGRLPPTPATDLVGYMYTALYFINTFLGVLALRR